MKNILYALLQQSLHELCVCSRRSCKDSSTIFFWNISMGFIRNSFWESWKVFQIFFKKTVGNAFVDFFKQIFQRFCLPKVSAGLPFLKFWISNRIFIWHSFRISISNSYYTFLWDSFDKCPQGFPQKLLQLVFWETFRGILLENSSKIFNQISFSLVSRDFLTDFTTGSFLLMPILEFIWNIFHGFLKNIWDSLRNSLMDSFENSALLQKFFLRLILIILHVI